MIAVRRSAVSADAVPSSYSGRYLLALAVVALLVVLDAVAIQPTLVRLTSDAPVINVAGRQRMLSQKLTKAALALQSAATEEVRGRRQRELQTVLEQWTLAHESLQVGNAEMRLPETRSQEIRDVFAELQPHFEAMREAGQNICQEAAKAGSGGNDGMSRDCVATILEHEAQFLPIMDRIVGLYEREARERVAHLRFTKLSIMGTILAILLGVGLFVVRPATRLIDEQFQQLRSSEAQLREAHHVLELRVEERTRQLSESNHSLAREIEERERAQARTRDVLDQLAHASRVTAIGQLATGLAHELNQPLGAIANYAETCDLLLKGPPGRTHRDVRVRSAVQRIRAAALRAGTIIRRMRGFVQQNGSHRETVDLNALMSEVCELCLPEARRADVLLDLDLDHQVSQVRIDPVQIQQVFVNLVQNSIQAMVTVPRDQRQVVLRTEQVGDKVQISVLDTGPGFPGDPMASFQPFRSTKSDGLGIGLSISQSIVHAHEGEIRAESRVEAGAVVRVELPGSPNEDVESEQSSDEACAHSVCGG